MTLRVFGHSLLTVALFASAALASSKSMPNVPRTDEDLAKAVRHEILMYPQYTLWDDISFRVDNGNVMLSGAVSQPYKKDDIGRLARSEEHTSELQSHSFIS